MINLIGSTYKETRARLKKSIRDGTIPTIDTEGDKYVCYFCEKPIEGRMHVLIDHEVGEGRDSYSEYYIGEDCFKGAKMVRFI